MKLETAGVNDQLPEPLVPADCDLRDFAFMPLDVVRLRDSDLASEETPEACWAAVLLWCASWHQVPAGSIPDSDQWQAKQAGYMARGKIDKAWAGIRAGALRGWLKCSDGRLYHPVVAEKACEAWRSKLQQRWRTECARIKKHNQRHGTEIEYPEFDEWLSLGCPQGQTAIVPKDKERRPEEVPGETASNRQGQGQGQGLDIPTPDGVGAAPPKKLSTAERKTRMPKDFGISDSVRAWAKEKGFDPFLQAHLEKFKTAVAANGSKYVDWDAAFRNCIADDWGDIRRNALRAQGKTLSNAEVGKAWWQTQPGIIARGAKYEMRPDPDKPFVYFRDAVVAEAKRRGEFEPAEVPA